LACHTSSLKPYHRFGLAKQTSMTFPHVRAVKLSGETFALDGNLQVATTSLEKDGCLLLKGATDLRPIEPSMEARYSQKGFEKTSEDDGSLDIGSTLDSVARDVYLNRVSGYATLQIFLTAVTRSLALYCSPPATNTSSPLTTPSYTSTKSDSGWGVTLKLISTLRNLGWSWSLVYTWVEIQTCHGSSVFKKALEVEALMAK